MNRIVSVAVVVAALGLGLVGCGTRPDPCVQQMPAPTAEQVAKFERGLEVDESIEDGSYEVECVLVKNRDGSYGWVSETDD